jgi:hypothetical protein
MQGLTNDTGLVISKVITMCAGAFSSQSSCQHFSCIQWLRIYCL